jgi:hypothetical protein
MKKIILLAGFLCLTPMLFHLHAQSIDNRDWKAYFTDPFNDTLTFHIHADSSFATTSSGDILVRTKCTVSGDILTLADYGGEHACLDMTGKYKINLSGDTLILTLIEDPCDGRAQALDGKKWTESK